MNQYFPYTGPSTEGKHSQAPDKQALSFFPLAPHSQAGKNDSVNKSLRYLLAARLRMDQVEVG